MVRFSDKSCLVKPTKMTDFILRTKSNLDTLYAAVWARMEREGLLPLLVSVKAYKPPKTPPQLAKIHAMCRDFGISQGYDLETAKAWVKDELIYVRFTDKKDGSGVIAIRKSFGNETKEGMSILIDRLYALAIEWNVELSDE